MQTWSRLHPREALIRQHALREPVTKRRDQRQPTRMDTNGDPFPEPGTRAAENRLHVAPAAIPGAAIPAMGG